MKVLVVDDDVVSRMMLMHLVDGCGPCEILEAEDGEEAWALLAAGTRPAIVFCDLRMPKLDGMALLARLRDPGSSGDPTLAALPFVLVSAASDAGTLAEAGRLGADGYIVKPFALGQVKAQLERLLPPVQQEEDPRETMRRLGIDAQRLQLYFDGLRRQLDEARAACAGPAPERAVPLGRLAEGCATLGLTESATRLRAAAQPGGDALGAIVHALASARRQQERAQG